MAMVFGVSTLCLSLPSVALAKAGGKNPDRQLTQSRSINPRRRSINSSLENAVKVIKGIIPKFTVNLGSAGWPVALPTQKHRNQT